MPTYTKTANSNVRGGTQNNAATTAAACQSVCTAMVGCTGCDFDNNKNVCFTISFNSSGMVNAGATGVDHYDQVPCITGILQLLACFGVVENKSRSILKRLYALSYMVSRLEMCMTLTLAFIVCHRRT